MTNPPLEIESRPSVVFDSWLAKYGEPARRAPGGLSRLYGLLAHGDEPPVWKLLAVDEDSGTALREGVGTILTEIIHHHHEDLPLDRLVEVWALCYVNNGQAELATVKVVEGAPERVDATKLTDDELRALIETGGDETVTVERVRAGAVPCTAVNLVCRGGLAASVSIFYPGESSPVFERNEQWADEVEVEPQGEADNLLIGAVSFVTVARETVRSGHRPDAHGLIEYASERARETGDPTLLGTVLRVVGTAMTEGLLNIDPDE